MSAGGLSLGVKRPGRETDPSPPSMELNLHSPIRLRGVMLSLKNTGTNLPFFFFTQLASRSELHTFKVVHGGNLKTVPKPFPLNRCFRHRYFLSTRASPTAYCSLVLVRNMRPSRLSLPSPKKLPWSRVLLEKLTVTQLVKRLLVSYVNLRFITCSLESATGPYPEPHEFRPQSHTLFL